ASRAGRTVPPARCVTSAPPRASMARFRLRRCVGRLVRFLAEWRARTAPGVGAACWRVVGRVQWSTYDDVPVRELPEQLEATKAGATRRCGARARSSFWWC